MKAQEINYVYFFNIRIYHIMLSLERQFINFIVWDSARAPLGVLRVELTNYQAI